MSVFEEIGFASGACRRLMISLIIAIGLIRKTSFPRRRESRISRPLIFLMSAPFYVLLLSLLPFLPYPRPAQAADIKTDLSLSTGYRVDDFSWNIAGNVSGTNPNVLSELTWSDLEILQTVVSGRALVNERVYLRGSFGYGWAFSGDNLDADFSGNDRTQEYSRSSNSADGSTVLDAALGLGYQFAFLSGKFRLSPLLGYSYSAQTLTLKDGVQVIATPGRTPPAGPIRGLDSTYDASWLGPWLGIDLAFEITERITLFGSLEYHWATFDAECNLNLRNDLAHPKSFEHDADGKGFLIGVSAEYLLGGAWSLNMSFNYQKWSTDPGHDRVYYVNGSAADTRLNEVNWDSYALMLGLAYRFGHR
jgi:outer membrane protease